MTDTERLDFLDRQRWTRWSGYDTPHGSCVWPVFAGRSYRDALDRAMRSASKASPSPQGEAPLWTTA